MNDPAMPKSAVRVPCKPRVIGLIAAFMIGGVCLTGCPPEMPGSDASVLLTVSSEQTGEMISFIGPTDALGNGSEATAAVYQLPDGRKYTILLGADGQVSEIVANGVVFKFTNWTTNSVLLTLYEGSASASATIPIDNSGGKPRYSVMQSRGDSLRRLARAVSYAGCGLSVVKGTLITAATGLAGAPVGIAIVALGCDSVLANLLGVELPPAWAEARCAIALGSGQWDTAVGSCGSAGLNHLADYEDAQATIAGTQQANGYTITDTEPNNFRGSQGQSLDLSRGLITVRGTIGPDGSDDVDYYCFTAQSGDTLVITATCFSCNSETFLFVELFDPPDDLVGEVVMFNSTSKSFQYTVPASGEYAIGVFQVRELTGYEFTLRRK